MKRLIIVAVFGLISNVVIAQDSQTDSLKNKLLSDTAAFEQFIFLGKCNCIDEVIKSNNAISKKKEKANNLERAFTELEMLNFPGAVLFKKESISLVLRDYQQEKYLEIVKTYNDREDFYKRRTKYPLLPCDRIFTKNDELYQLYSRLIRDPTTYKNEYKIEEYLKAITYLNSDGW